MITDSHITRLLICVLVFTLMVTRVPIIASSSPQHKLYINERLLKYGILTCNKTYHVKKKINLHGRVLELPDSCCIVYEKGCFYNGKVVFKNTTLKGSISFRCRTGGTIINDTIRISWFKYSDHAIADAFGISDKKVLVFPDNELITVNYGICIPSCKVIGNNSTISLSGTHESSVFIRVAKIRNAHYDGGGIDTFSISNLHFITSTDNVYLFNMQNTRDCLLSGCSFTCRGSASECSHAVDLRGNNTNTTFDKCQIVNESDSKAGGGIWIRSFGKIQSIRIQDCYFFNNSTDEIFALNAVTDDITDIHVSNCSFVYKKGKACPEPHVMWGMTYKSGSIDNVEFVDCHLKSDFVPAYILNDARGDNIKVVNSSFSFEGATLNAGKLNTTLFNGRLSFENSSIVITNINRQDETTSITLFSGLSFVRHSTIQNNSKDVFLGAPNIYYSDINYNNSQLFNGHLPKEMVGCRIKLGDGTPKLAANPYDQNADCDWRNNVIESEYPVDFNFSYKKSYLRNVGNQMRNITVQGSPYKY